MLCSVNPLQSLISSEIVSSSTRVDTSRYPLQSRMVSIEISMPNAHFENWGDSGINASQCTDNSTDIDMDEKKQMVIMWFIAFLICLLHFLLCIYLVFVLQKFMVALLRTELYMLLFHYVIFIKFMKSFLVVIENSFCTSQQSV